jgi:hypothetical protein
MFVCFIYSTVLLPGCTTAQAVRCCLLTAESRVQCRMIICEFRGEGCGTVPGIYPLFGVLLNHDSLIVQCEIATIRQHIIIYSVHKFGASSLDQYKVGYRISKLVIYFYDGLVPSLHRDNIDYL